MHRYDTSVKTRRSKRTCYVLICERGLFLMSRAQFILFCQSLRPNETKFYSTYYSNDFRICSQNSCFRRFFLRMCRARATKSDFDVFHLLVVTGITFAWVFHIRTFRVSYFLRGHCISTCFFYDVFEQAFLLSASQCVIHDVCPFRSTKIVWFQFVIFTTFVFP